MPEKSDKQLSCEEWLKNLRQAEKLVDGVADELRGDTSFDMNADQVGHFLTHAANLKGSIAVLIGQLDGIIAREVAKVKKP